MARRALIIAVENYSKMKEGLGPILPGTHKNALAFRQWLIDDLKVAEPDIFFCTEDAAIAGRTADASRSGVIDELLRLRAAGKDQTEALFVYFSGHGLCYVDADDIPTADVLLTQDYVERARSGDACLKLDEIQKWLKMNLGSVGGSGSNHHYFIDACRNKATEREIKVLGLGLTYEISQKKKPSVYTIYSTPVGAVAGTESDFPPALIDGLAGKGHAKRWVGRKLAVVFDSLRGYLEERLEESLDPRSEGGGDGLIREVEAKPFTCTIDVQQAATADVFEAEVLDERGDPLPQKPFSFTGARGTFSALPDQYYIRLRHAAAAVLPAEPQLADLFDDCMLTFTKQPAGVPPAAPAPGGVVGASAPGPARSTTGASVRITAPAGTTVIVRGPMRRDPVRGTGVFSADLAPGPYVVETVDERGVTIDHRDMKVTPGRHTLDLSGFRESPLRSALRASIHGAHSHGSVDFSETIGPMADQRLETWLSIVGASRIIGADRFSKLGPLPLARFDALAATAAPFYLLAGFDDDKTAFAAVVSPDWKAPPVPIAAHPQLPGLFELAVHSPDAVRGFLTVRVGAGSSLTLPVASLAGRGTLVAITRDERGGLQVLQLMLPLSARLGDFSTSDGLWIANDPDPDLVEVQQPLRAVRRLIDFQLAFARGREMRQALSSKELRLLMALQWFEPVSSVLGAYSLARTGDLAALATFVPKLRAHLLSAAVGVRPGSDHGLTPDVEALSLLASLPFTRPRQAPLVLDGMQALDLLSEGDNLPPAETLDFRGPWTMWRDAVT